LKTILESRQLKYLSNIFWEHIIDWKVTSSNDGKIRKVSSFTLTKIIFEISLYIEITLTFQTNFVEVELDRIHNQIENDHIFDSKNSECWRVVDGGRSWLVVVVEGARLLGGEGCWIARAMALLEGKMTLANGVMSHTQNDSR